jgi:hypothetical protein
MGHPPKANRMARDTYDHLTAAAGRLGSTGGKVGWEKIDKLVDKFNRATTDKEKSKILEEVRTTIRNEKQKNQQALTEAPAPKS